MIHTYSPACPTCGDRMQNNLYHYEGPEDHVCVKREDSETMFGGLESLLAKWLPFSTYMAERRLAI